MKKPIGISLIVLGVILSIISLVGYLTFFLSPRVRSFKGDAEYWGYVLGYILFPTVMAILSRYCIKEGNRKIKNVV